MLQAKGKQYLNLLIRKIKISLLINAVLFKCKGLAYNMKIKQDTKYRSIVYDFVRLSIIFILIILLLSCWSIWFAYREGVKNKIEHLPIEAARVDYEIHDSIESIEKYAEFIGEKIAEKGAHDLDYIAYLMSGSFNTEPQKHNLYITTLFDWVDPNKKMWVSSDRGIFDEPKDLSHRSYLDRTPLYPWTLQFSEPATGVPSGQWIIPAGMGIEDKDGTFLGSVTMGFVVDGLYKKIVASLGNSDINFIILTSDFKLVATAHGITGKNRQDFIPLDLLGKELQLQRGSGFLKNPIEYESMVFSYYKKLDKYPFIVLTGYNKNFVYHIFYQTLIQRSLDILLIVAFLVLMLLLINKRIVKPIVSLANYAASLASKDEQAKLPVSRTYEIRNLSKQLIRIKKAEKAREVAESANREKSNFLASMSHELRTPLHTIMGYSDITRMGVYGKLPEKYQEVAGVIRTAADHLLKLIEDILDLAKIEAGKMELVEERIEVGKIVDLVLIMVMTRAEAKNIKLNKELPEYIPVLRSDELRMKQMLLNLLSNAVKFTPEGGVVTVGVEVGEELRIWVRDTGVGVAREDIPNILKEYGQARGITKQHREQGAGLGLAIVGRIMDLHGGRLTFESEVGKGSIVTLLFPKERWG